MMAKGRRSPKKRKSTKPNHRPQVGVSQKKLMAAMGEDFLHFHNSLMRATQQAVEKEGVTMPTSVLLGIEKLPEILKTEELPKIKEMPFMLPSSMPGISAELPSDEGQLMRFLDELVKLNSADEQNEADEESTPNIENDDEAIFRADQLYAALDKEFSPDEVLTFGEIREKMGTDFLLRLIRVSGWASSVNSFTKADESYCVFNECREDLTDADFWFTLRDNMKARFDERGRLVNPAKMIPCPKLADCLRMPEGGRLCLLPGRSVGGLSWRLLQFEPTELEAATHVLVDIHYDGPLAPVEAALNNLGFYAQRLGYYPDVKQAFYAIELDQPHPRLNDMVAEAVQQYEADLHQQVAEKLAVLSEIQKLVEARRGVLKYAELAAGVLAHDCNNLRTGNLRVYSLQFRPDMSRFIEDGKSPFTMSGCSLDSTLEELKEFKTWLKEYNIANELLRQVTAMREFSERWEKFMTQQPDSGRLEQECARPIDPQSEAGPEAVELCEKLNSGEFAHLNFVVDGNSVCSRFENSEK